MIINIPSKDKVYTLVNDTVFDRTVFSFTDSATVFDKRFGSRNIMINPLDSEYFNSFDIDFGTHKNSALEASILLQVILSDITLSDVTPYIQSAFPSKVSIRIRNKSVPTLGNLMFKFGHAKIMRSIPNGISPKNPHTIDLDFGYITGVVVPAGTTIKFSGYNMSEEMRRVEIVDSLEEFLKPSKLMTPANKALFGSFSKKVTFDLTIDQINGMEVV